MDALAVHYKVPQELQTKFQDEAWDAATFGMCATSFAELDDALQELIPLKVLSLQERSCIRLLWQHCFSLASGTSSSAALVPTSAAQAAADAGTQDSASWSNPFPPKVASATFVSLQKDFLKAYTSEVLDADTLPSPRLLALVKQNVDNLGAKVGWRWIPWKFRLSQKAHDDKDSIALGTRPRKIAKLDLSDLLLDDIPLREIPSGGQLGNYQLSQILSLHSVAVSLCKGCHLSTLKAYDRAFLELATKRYSADLNLRTPFAQELEHGDRMLWEQVSSLLVDGWKLDDALHQVTAVRSSLHVLLAPRPCPPKLLAPGGKGQDILKGNGRGRGAKGNGGRGRGGKGATHTDTLQKRQKWATTFNNKTLCLRFNSRAGCADKNCKYLHQCCVVDENNNKVCGGKHPAFEHKSGGS